MSAPEQLRPPVYGCAAGTVLHAHAADTLEPGVLLYTFLPPGLSTALRESEPRVDVHADGAQASTLTVRLLVQDTALSWQLPLAPFVAALPGQSGDEGRMVLLAVVDAEPAQGFWTQPVDCEHLAAELQLPVAELAEALRGRLTPWLDEDLRLLLEDDAYHRAADRSPAQTLADAVLATYRGDLEAERAVSRLLRALSMAPAEHSAELGDRLAGALVAAFDEAEPPVLAAVAEQSGPFESEVLRLLAELPPLLVTTPADEHLTAALNLLVVGGDMDETVRGALTLITRLVRSLHGSDLPDEAVLQHLLMVDDRGLARLADLWVRLASATESADPAADQAAVIALAERVRDEGKLGRQWLEGTGARLADLVRRQPARVRERGSEVLTALTGLPPEEGQLPADEVAVLHACVQAARLIRAKGRRGPGAWLQGPATAAVQATLAAYAEGLSTDTTVDLLSELLAEDITSVDLLDGYVCATAQLLGALDPGTGAAVRETQVAELLQALPTGARGARWLLAACLLEAPHHDRTALDLSGYVPPGEVVDADRAAERLGVPAVLRLGLQVLDALAEVLGSEAQATRLDVLTAIFASALVEHELVRLPG